MTRDSVDCVLLEFDSFSVVVVDHAICSHAIPLIDAAAELIHSLPSEMANDDDTKDTKRGYEAMSRYTGNGSSEYMVTL